MGYTLWAIRAIPPDHWARTWARPILTVTGGMPMLRKDLKNHSDAVWHVVRYARSDGLSVQVVLT